MTCELFAGRLDFVRSGLAQGIRPYFVDTGTLGSDELVGRGRGAVLNHVDQRVVKSGEISTCGGTIIHADRREEGR